MNGPTPARIDKLCAELTALETACDKADKAYAAKESEILALVNQWGASPDGADKSLRLEGNKFQATSIGGLTTEIDQTGVLKFRLALAKARCGHLFSTFFTTTTKYTVVAGAEQLLANPPARAPKNLAALYHACLSFKPKKARLDVKPLGGKAKAGR